MIPEITNPELGTIIKKGKGGSAEMASAVTSAYDEWDNM
ncbi:unnamed protein product [Brugia timori]|uniref:Uncharacterized protein n=1 Tax=Brugia timori TaxID=42155 RepID=A0A3P7W0C2_9BILA|nr:unnamed protein product [Brugia timori]